MAKRRRILDSDGVEVTAGCTISFGYGIPNVSVWAEVIERNGALIALTKDHNPAECKVSLLRRHVGEFWVRRQQAQREMGKPDTALTASDDRSALPLRDGGE